MVQYDNCIKYFEKTILTELNVIAYCFVAGGCVRDYFSIGKLSSDIDIYFSSENDFNLIRSYLINGDKEYYYEDDLVDGRVKLNKPKDKAVVLYENANVIKVRYKGKIFDLVQSIYGQPNDIISKFDFTVACAAVDLKQVYTHGTFFIDLSKRQLMINELPFPISTLWRLQKYIKKGYTICKGETLKLATAITAMSITTEDGNTTIVDSQLSEDGSLFMGFD